MAAQVAGQVGNQTVADGSSNVPFRQGRTGEMVKTNLHGNYYELASRGQIFSGMTSVTGTTIVSGNNSPVAAGAASIITVYNPVNSGINVELLKAWLVGISGTPGVGSFVYNIGYSQLITAVQNNGGVSGATPQSNNAGSSGGIAKIFTQTALTSSSVQVLMRPIGGYFGGALTATTPGINIYDQIDGEIVLPPGSCLTLASPATGTTFVVAAGFTWAEVKI